jgi:hypothetical protein
LKQTASAIRGFAIFEQTANRFARRFGSNFLSSLDETLFVGVVDVLLLPVLDKGFVVKTQIFFVLGEEWNSIAQWRPWETQGLARRAEKMRIGRHR